MPADYSIYCVLESLNQFFISAVIFYSTKFRKRDSVRSMRYGISKLCVCICRTS